MINRLVPVDAVVAVHAAKRRWGSASARAALRIGVYVRATCGSWRQQEIGHAGTAVTRGGHVGVLAVAEVPS